MAARPVLQLHVHRKPDAEGEEPAESSTRIKRSPAQSEDAEAAIQASLAAALQQLDHLELEASSAARAGAVAKSPIRSFPKGMPPLPVARALPRNMPPLPTSPALCPPTPWAPDVAVVRAPPRIPTPRRSAKPIAVALLLLGVFGGGLYVTTATELGARAARLVRP